MSTTRNNNHPGNYGSIVFHCDEVGCENDLDSERTTWKFAVSEVKGEGWYFFPNENSAGWTHYCAWCGKTRWIAKQQEKERAEQLVRATAVNSRAKERT